MTDSTTTQAITLDEILEQTAERWREYRRDHPRLPELPIGPNAADMCAGFAFTRDLIPTDRSTLLRLADDERVWKHRIAFGDTDTVEDAIREAVETVVDSASCALDEAGR